MVTGGVVPGLGEKERTAGALGTRAVGMSTLGGRMHPHALGTQGHPIRLALKGEMPLMILGHSGNACMKRRVLLHVPGVNSSSSQMGWEWMESKDSLRREWAKRRHVSLMERRSLCSQHPIAVVRSGGCGDARALSPEEFLRFFGGAVCVLLSGAARDTQAVLRSTREPLGGRSALSRRRARCVPGPRRRSA